MDLYNMNKLILKLIKFGSDFFEIPLTKYVVWCLFIKFLSHKFRENSPENSLNNHSCCANAKRKCSFYLTFTSSKASLHSSTDHVGS